MPPSTHKTQADSLSIDLKGEETPPTSLCQSYIRYVNPTHVCTYIRAYVRTYVRTCTAGCSQLGRNVWTPTFLHSKSGCTASSAAPELRMKNNRAADETILISLSEQGWITLGDCVVGL